ncbi:lipopolysaccharide export system permease protein [Sagittula marina]|uniref:Lipopolysaccharide export system permease protein n=1 Tax=Sagittula marina TaxID=943940 RepID=A0A7W6GSG9_9RHOB|nr:lipopolysaccharide export system permease protein [Sagittula marina]
MQRFDRYVLSQLMVLFGFFALVLVSVYWVNRAVVLFDRLIADGHSALVVLEFTLLSLPAVIALVLPLSVFAAAVYVTNRLSGDSELTVVQATGYSPWRLARPYLIFGVFIAFLMAVLTNILVPQAMQQLRDREQELSGSLSAALLREGTFLHPTSGITFYIREITVQGELRDVLLSDRRQADRATTYTAERAYLLRDDEGPKMVMLAGMAQTMELDKQRLSTTNFADFTYDLSGLISTGRTRSQKTDAIPTLQLLSDPAAIEAINGDTRGEVLEEAHSRIQGPLLCVVAALIGYAALMIGGFSRFGVTKQIVFAIFLLVLVKVVESAAAPVVVANAALWPLIYAPSLVGSLMVWGLLWQAARPFRPRRRAQVTEATV